MCGTWNLCDGAKLCVSVFQLTFLVLSRLVFLSSCLLVSPSVCATSRHVSKLSDELKPLHMAADQTDALVDVYYYSQNAACKKGMNMSAVFEMVHAANMAKRDPATGEFLKRADGKIIKPAGWKAPDVEGEIVRQHKEGSFTPL